MDRRTDLAMTDYAAHLLSRADFAFQPRTGARIPLRRIATEVDLAAIVRENDVGELSRWREDVAFCDVSRDELSPGSRGTHLLQVFRLAQLMIEHLSDANGVLAASLNGLARKYAAKKVEIEELKTTVAGGDAEVAMLRDELHDMKHATATGNALDRRVDPSLYPSQERCPTSATPTSLENLSPGSPVDASKGFGCICLHIVLASQATYLQISAEDSISVDELEKVATEKFGLDAEHSLYHKNEELKDKSQPLRLCDIKNDAALVLVPRPTTSDTVPDIATEVKTLNLEPRLKDVASKSPKELALQSHVSVQEKKAAPALRLVASSPFRREIEEKVQRRHQQHESKPEEEQEQASALSLLSMSTGSDQSAHHVYVSSQESEDSGDGAGICVFGKCKDGDKNDETVGDANNDYSMYSSSETSANQNPHSGKTLPEKDNVSDHKSREDFGIHKCKAVRNNVMLKINTSAEVAAAPTVPPAPGGPHPQVFDKKACQFSPPSEIEVSKNGESEGTAENESVASSMQYSASSTQLALSLSSCNIQTEPSKERTPTPSKGYLGRQSSSEEAVRTLSASPKNKFGEAKHIRFSDAETEAEEYSANISTPENVSIRDTTLVNPSSWPPMTLDSSIEVTHFEYILNAEPAREKSISVAARKKKGYFLLKDKKRLPFKNIFKRKKPNSKGGIIEV